MPRMTFLTAAVVIAGLVLALGAVSPGDRNAQAAPEDDIEALVMSFMDAWNAGDAEAVMGLYTTNGLENTFGSADPAEAAAVVAETIEGYGPIASAAARDIFVTSGNASAITDIAFEFGFSLYEKTQLLFLDGSWKIDGSELASRPIPEGVPSVPMFLSEYAFTFDQNATKSGNFAFMVENIGQEEHEVLVVKLNTSDGLPDIAQALLESEEFPEGVEFVTVGGFYTPGAGNTVIFEDGLDQGRYGLVCFFPAPDGTPHLALGMVSEFTVGSATHVSAPSAGDAGLAAAGNEGRSYAQTFALAAGPAVTVILLAAFVKAKWRSRSRQA